MQGARAVQGRATPATVQLRWQVARLEGPAQGGGLGIKRPDLIRHQIDQRQAELRAQGDCADGEIERARKKLTDVDSERAFYQRQAARGKITEQEFDGRMDETEQQRQHWQEELVRLKELRDNTVRVNAGLDYSEHLLTAMRTNLESIDRKPEELTALPQDRQDAILKERQRIMQALVERVNVYADGRVEVLGVLDGTEAGQFELVHPGRVCGPDG